MNVLNNNIVPLLKGDKGDGLEIKKWYDSVEDMTADYSNSDIAVGDTVAIKNTLALYEKGSTAFESRGSMKGENGDDGTTFTPSVSEEGVLSWTNDGGKENPAAVNIKGADGDVGEDTLVYKGTKDFTGEPGGDFSLSASNFNRTPKTGDLFLLVATWSTENRSWICGARIGSSIGNNFFVTIQWKVETTGEQGAKGDTGDAAASWEKVRFTDETPTTTIETSSGVKQIKIRVSGEDIPNESDDCVVLSEEILLYLSPDGTMSEETMKPLVLSVYNGAASMAYAHGFDYFTNDVVTYDCSSMGFGTAGSTTGRQFVLKDISGATYPDGLSIASLPDGAAAQAMYAVKALKKAAAAS